MKSSFIVGILAASVALTANAALAAPTQVNPIDFNASRVQPPAHVAARALQPRTPLNVDIGQFIQGMLGGPLPPQYAQIVRNAMRESASSGSYESSGSYDFSPPSPTVGVDNSQSQAAIDAADQAMQQEDQSLQDLDASIAAAEQENDAANAATLQTEINAGM